MDNRPLVSIITPSYNQGKFLEETIRSIKDQTYKNIEHIIIDGGSTDNSIDIIKQYQASLAYWVSEPDNGQTDAINKGFRRAQGTIIAWLNSDDVYLPKAVETAVESLTRDPSVDMLYGACELIDQDGRKVGLVESKAFSMRKLLMMANSYIAQPTVFFRKNLLKSIGYLDTSLDYVMDYDYWLRIGKQHTIRNIPDTLAKFRLHSASKSVHDAIPMHREACKVRDSHFQPGFGEKALYWVGEIVFWTNYLKAKYSSR